MNIGLHSQTYKHPIGNIAGSEITTNGLAAAFNKIKEVKQVCRFAPGNWSQLDTAHLDLLIIEGWHTSLNAFIEEVRKANPNVMILFWNLSFWGFNEVVKLDVDGYLSNSKKVAAVLKQIKPTEFVMLAADADNFYPFQEELNYQHDAVYLGMYHQDKSEEIMNRIIGEAAEFDLVIYGSGWNDHSTLRKHWAGRLPERDIALLYSSCKVVLGTTEDRQRMAGMINNRVFEALACGACFISEYSVEMERVFGNAVFFSQKSGDTRNHIQRILTDYKGFSDEASLRRELIVENHTYHHRVNQILQFYRSFQNG